MAGKAGHRVVAASDEVQELSPVHGAMLGMSIYNDADGPLYVLLGEGASPSAFTVKMAPASLYEVPFGYSGVVTGIWESGATGMAQVTEVG